MTDDTGNEGKKTPPNPLAGFDMESLQKQMQEKMQEQMAQMQNFDMAAYVQMAQAATEMAAKFGANLNEQLKSSTELNLDPNSNLTPAQNWVLAIGAILTMRNNHTLNTLRTQLTEIEAQEALATWWGIEDAIGAKETVTWLQDGGHRIYFNQIRELEGRGLGGEELQKSLHMHDKPLGAEPGTLSAYYKKYRAGLRHLKYAKILTADEDVTSLNAWDFGRLVNVVRWCVDARYFDETTAWDILLPVARVTQKSYGSWDELTKAYLLGRLFWNEETDEIETLTDSFQLLRERENSPYRTLAWNTPLG